MLRFDLEQQTRHGQLIIDMIYNISNSRASHLLDVKFARFLLLRIVLNGVPSLPRRRRQKRDNRSKVSRPLQANTKNYFSDQV